MKLIRIFVSIATILLMSSSAAECLTPLTPVELKSCTAQAGVSIAVSDVVTEHFFNDFRFADPDDPTNQNINFQNINIVSRLSIGKNNVNGDSRIDPFTIDIGSINNMVMMALIAPDLECNIDFTSQSILFNGANLGSLSISNMYFTDFSLMMGPHPTGTGIEFSIGSKVSIDNFQFRYRHSSGQPESFSFGKTTLCNSFTDNSSDIPEDPKTWKSSGPFIIGNPSNFGTFNSASIDIAGDLNQTWNFVDGTGTAYSVSNPRYNSGFIALNLPMSGSIRIENIKFGPTGNSATNLGPLIMDGIKVERLSIEIPGRGLGNSK
jgi:hypothetical protein